MNQHFPLLVVSSIRLQQPATVCSRIFLPAVVTSVASVALTLCLGSYASLYNEDFEHRFSQSTIFGICLLMAFSTSLALRLVMPQDHFSERDNLVIVRTRHALPGTVVDPSKSCRTHKVGSRRSI